MAARWIGLARQPRAATCKHRTWRECARAFGAAGVLMMAAGLNFTLYPEALADVIGVEAPVGIGAFAPDASLAPAPAATAGTIAVNEDEVRLLAATVWGEARSEGEDGMRAVAHVMLNRVGDRFGHNLETVILTPWQFSVWNRGDPNRRLVQNPERFARGGIALETWQTAQRVAREVLSGQSVDPTNGALFYHTRAVRPTWARYGQGRQVIGQHVFYADVPDAGVRRTPRTRDRVTQVAATVRPEAVSAPERGPRAGRVNGVIQYAPPNAARQPLPSEGDVNAAATPTLNGVPVATATGAAP